MLEQELAENIIENLRQGIPPKRGVREYSVGNDELLGEIQARHLHGRASSRGKIRFVSGSWGSGKTHFLRQLRELAFDANYLVSSVELNVDETPFNKFEEVFYRIVQQIGTPEIYRKGREESVSPIGEVFKKCLFGTPSQEPGAVVPRERYDAAVQALMANTLIDIDFRRMVQHYWETYLPEAGDAALLETRRGQILQWFAGEGTIGTYRKPFGVQKLVDRQNARLMLRSLGHFATHSGYAGIVILFDEAEMSYSSMRKSDLKKAHNNLLHLINGIEEAQGLFLAYATTPDFFTDERHGITIYGALSQRIGRPEEHPPRGLDRVWNLDQSTSSADDYQQAAKRIRAIYATAYPESSDSLLADEIVPQFAQELIAAHPRFSSVGIWRVLVAGMVRRLDLEQQGEKVPPTKELHRDIIESLKEM